MKRLLWAIPILFFGISPGTAADFTSGIIKVGCAQIPVTDNVQANLEKIVAYIEKADSQGIQILVFPETALSGYRPYHFKDGPFPEKAVLERALEQVCRKTGELKMNIVLGTTSYADGGLYNIVYFIDDRGEIIASHAKTHGTGGKYFLRGKEIRTFESGGMKFGMQICYDARFPEAWRMQALQGAKIIFHSSFAAGGDAWKIPVWEAHVRSRAAENGIWVVSCNTSGPVQAGKSYIADPDGLLIAESNQEKEELISGVIDLSRSNQGNISNRRTDIYKLLPIDLPAQ